MHSYRRRNAAMLFVVLSVLTGVAGCAAMRDQQRPAATRERAATGSYAVVVSQQTYAIAEWKQVVETLRKKHDAAAIVYAGSVWDARAELGRIMPRHACFVARPEECGRDLVVAVERMTRQLDDDPYTDVVWGILTGQDAADALRIAGRDKPLVVGSTPSACDAADLDHLDEGIELGETAVGGGDQAIRYTAVTFSGFVGCGTNGYFEDQRDRYSFAESFYLISQALVHELELHHPRIARIDLERYDAAVADQLARRQGVQSRAELGLVWERDIIAFYGDPAWNVRRTPDDPGWRDALTESDGVYTLTITATRDGRWGRYPIILFLPERLENIDVRQGEELMPVVTDNFILLPLSGEYRRGDVRTLVFEAQRAKAIRTSSMSPAVVAVPAKADRAAVSETPVPVEVPEEYRHDVEEALTRAGDNAPQLIGAIVDAPLPQRKAVCFLVANMPDVDLQALTRSYILENVAWAYRAREELPWGRDIPEELFLNYVLPYVSINERRDDWRRDFYQRFRPVVEGCRTAAEAAQKLNREVFPMLGVRYHATKRPKADQSPYETIEAGYASCTGLSVLLTDACRAVCVPARFAGTPQWTGAEGNHSWVEVWDRQWYFTGAAEPDPNGLNRAGFVDNAAKADVQDPIHWIYATSFKKTDLSFLMVWNVGLEYVPAQNVTKYYTDRKTVGLQVFDRRGGQPVAARVVLRLRGETYAVGETLASSPDKGGILKFELPGTETYELEIAPTGVGEFHTSFRTTDEDGQTVAVFLEDIQS